MSHKRRSRGGGRFRKNNPPTHNRLDFFTKEDFVSLGKRNESELIKDISNDIKKFQCTLEKTDICKKNFKLVISLLLKVSNGLSTRNDDKDIRLKAISILGEVFSERCPIFRSQLKIYVGVAIGETEEVEENIESVCNFFEVLLNRLPDSTWRILPVDELLQTVQLLADADMFSQNMLSKSEHLKVLRDAMKDEERIKSVQTPCAVSKRTWDNSEYRTVEILPQWDEIKKPWRPYKLRPNIVEGKYDDWLHYYDIQFRLLREDFISPLRKGIKDYIDGKVGRDVRNLKVYDRVHIVNTKFTRAGLCHLIKFDTTPFQRYRWEHSKRLIFGSFLCLSPDKFYSKVFFATVSNSDSRGLARGYLEVMFQGSVELLAHMRLGTQFVMVESLAYFEASRHILRSLQKAEIETMPFSRYLISNDCEEIKHPQYLNNGGVTSTYDMQFIVKHNAQNCSVRSTFQKLAITKPSQWPTVDMTDLDESQLQAIKMALTQEIAVIQGPPGTGKTYIGLKIVQALLKNRHTWNATAAYDILNFPFKPRSNWKSPILVMCLTNHALDQFLEGILDIHQHDGLRLIRIGGRSKNEKIQECSLSNVKRKLRNVPKEEYVAMKQLYNEVEVEGTLCHREICAYHDHDPKMKYILLSDLKCVIDDHHYESLLRPTGTPEEEKSALELWLGICDVIEHEEYVPIQSESEESSSYESSSDEDETSEEDDQQLDNGTHTNDISETASDHEDTGIDIVGNANIEEEARMIDGMTEMFQEMKFEEAPTKKKDKREKKIFRTRCVIKIVEHKNHKELKEHIVKQEPDMEEHRVKKLRNVHSLTKLSDRYKLYKYWHSKYRAHLLDQLEQTIKKYNVKCEEANKARQEAELYALETADVIGMTTTGAARYQHILHLVKPRIVIVEEAAEVLESHIVSALNAGTQHLILIGDHKQLRPNPNEYDLVTQYKLDISLFERLIKNDFPHVTLQIQHRMRPEISNLVRSHVYDVLHDHDSVKKYPKVKGISNNLFFIQHYELEKSNDLSHSNKHEAEYLAALCKYLLQQGYSPSQITLLVTYTGQLLLMKNCMPKSTFEGIRVATVDNFQGEENDIILLSLVRSNDRGSVGFLEIENRVCVALSRAKHGFYCIGNFEMLKKKADIWKSIISDMEVKGKIGESLSIHCDKHPDYKYEAKHPGDFKKHFPTGGCQLPCKFRLTCGHVCTLTCHSSDPEHLNYKCKKPCPLQCSEGHSCKQLCYQKCDQCFERVQRPLPDCDHLTEMFCHEDPSDITCYVRCTKTIPQCKHQQEMDCCEQPHLFKCRVRCIKVIPSCKHQQEMHCHQNPIDFRCREKCVKIFPNCKHPQEMFCYQDPATVKCESKCKQTCPEGHQCPLLCHQSCKPCKVMSDIKLPGCGHVYQKYCYQDISKIVCRLKCKKQCKFGHPCQLTCHEHFMTLGPNIEEEGCGDCKVIVEKTLKCGHVAQAECSKPSTDIKCRVPCKKKLSCGHKCPSLCGEHFMSLDPKIEKGCGDCRVIVEKTLKCGHVAKAECLKSSTDIKCRAPCKIN